MSEKKINRTVPKGITPTTFIHHPHDKYVRYVLQHKEIALSFFKYASSEAVRDVLDWASISSTKREPGFSERDLETMNHVNGITPPKKKIEAPMPRIQVSVLKIPMPIKASERAYQRPLSTIDLNWIAPAGNKSSTTMSIKPMLMDQNENFTNFSLQRSGLSSNLEAKSKAAIEMLP